MLSVDRQMCFDRVHDFGQSLDPQQAAFAFLKRQYCAQESFVVSELIAKKMNPYLEKRFVKAWSVAMDLLAPEKVKTFQSKRK